MSNAIDRLFQAHPEGSAFAAGYLKHLTEVLSKLDVKAIAACADAFWEARNRGSQIIFIGNGGSAATASHFANDIGIGTRPQGKQFRAISLTDNVATMTAISNDYGYDDVFLRQLQTVMRPQDVVVAISASGNSPNVMKAIEWANANGAITVGLTGFDGGKLAKAVKINLHVPTEKGEYGPVEDAHMVFDHLLGAYLMQKCRAEK